MPPTGARTHLSLSPALTGRLVALSPGAATVVLATLPEMRADERGLVHGGFVFGAADHAAMLAVNDPHVVLGAAETRFLAPVAVGQDVVLEAVIEGEKGRRRTVAVTGWTGPAGADSPVAARTPVFSGSFACFVLDQHVLDR